MKGEKFRVLVLTPNIERREAHDDVSNGTAPELQESHDGQRQCSDHHDAETPERSHLGYLGSCNTVGF